MKKTKRTISRKEETRMYCAGYNHRQQPERLVNSEELFAMGVDYHPHLSEEKVVFKETPHGIDKPRVFVGVLFIDCCFRFPYGMRDCLFYHCTFDGCTFEEAEFGGSRFSYCKFKGCTFNGANFYGSYWEHCDFQGDNPGILGCSFEHSYTHYTSLFFTPKLRMIWNCRYSPVSSS